MIHPDAPHYATGKHGGWLACSRCADASYRGFRSWTGFARRNRIQNMALHPDAKAWHERVYREMFQDYININISNMKDKETT